MKKFLLFLLAMPLLTGCVTYYYPQTAIEDDVYYAEDDPAYVNNAYVDYSYSSAYYPWGSLDYFYLGYGPRYGYNFGYGGYIGGGFSIGISYGYSPWYDPYYAYYSPWHYPHYAYYPYYRHGYGHKNRKNHHGRGNGRRGRGDEHYVGNDGTNRRNRGDGHEDGREDGREDPGNRRNRDNTGYNRVSPVRRYVSTSPAGHSGNQGMVIRSRETTKIPKSHTQPRKSAPAAVSSTATSAEGRSQRVYKSKQGNGEIRYRAATKKGRSRTGPVDWPLQSTRVVVAAAPQQTTNRSRQGSGEIRNRAATKPGKSRTSPVRAKPMGSASLRAVASAPVSSRTVTVPAQSVSNRQTAPVSTSRKSSGRSHSGGGSRSSGRSGSGRSSISSGRNRSSSSSRRSMGHK